MKRSWPAVFKENASKLDREVRELNSFSLYQKGCKTIKRNSETPTGQLPSVFLCLGGAYGPAKANELLSGATRLG